MSELLEVSVVDVFAVSATTFACVMSGFSVLPTRLSGIRGVVAEAEIVPALTLPTIPKTPIFVFL